MKLIEWNDDLFINIEEIDRQHKKLVDIINHLHAAMKARKAKEILDEIIEELIEYTEYHFDTEENYFIKYDYPESFIHKKTHRIFVKKVKQFQADFDRGKLLLSLEIMNFLKDWIEEHIKVVDMKYSDFFRQSSVPHCKTSRLKHQ
ncbi:MAG: bacteriohemerythrin [Candidatus Zixiibacteriota bacterium]